MFQIISNKFLKARDRWIDNNPRSIEFYEPLSDKTIKHKKAVLVSSSVVIIAHSIGVQITSFSGIKFEHMPDTNALVGFLFWVVLYEATTFLISFYSDLRARDFKRSVFNADKLLEANSYLIDHVKSISSLLEIHAESLAKIRAQSHSNNLNSNNHYASLEDTLKSILSNLEYSQYHDGSFRDSIESFKSNVKEFNTTKSYLRSKKILTYCFDLLIPFFIFMLALFVSYRDGFSVLSKIIDSLV